MPKVIFQTDQGPKTINFDSMPTQQDIEDVVKQQGWKPAKQSAAAPGATTTPQTPQGTGGVGGFFKGVAKGIGSTVAGLESAGQTLLEQTGGRVANLITGKGFTATHDTPNLKEALGENIKPHGTAENVGFWGEQLGEFLIPVGAIGKAEKAVEGVSTLSKLGKAGELIAEASPKLAKATEAAMRVGGKALVEGGANAAISLAQTGDYKEAAKTGLLFGTLKGITGAAGEALKAAKFPEYLYGKIFKSGWQDMYQKLKTEGLQAFKKDSPELFDQLVKSGAIKAGPSGMAIVNESLAKQALDRGLKGSVKDMSNQVVRGLVESEDIVKSIAKSSKKAVSIPEKAYYNVLKDIEKEYQDVAFGSISKKANTLAKAVKNGKVDGETALELRRFLDGLRIQSSYNPMSTSKLSLGQQNLKALTERLRTKVNALPGMKTAMKNYSFYIDALESLAKKANKEANAGALDLIDKALLGGGIFAHAPIEATALEAVKKTASSPKVFTNIAQKIQQGGLPTKVGAAAKYGLTKLMSVGEPNQ